MVNRLEGKIGHFWCWSNLDCTNTAEQGLVKGTWEWTDFVATEEISLHTVTANGNVYANIWWSIPSNWIRITSARIESMEQHNPPLKTPLTTFVVVFFSSFSAGQIIHMLCIPGKKFLKINGNLSKMFGVKNHIRFLLQNTFPQTPDFSAPM